MRFRMKVSGDGSPGRDARLRRRSQAETERIDTAAVTKVGMADG